MDIHDNNDDDVNEVWNFDFRSSTPVPTHPSKPRFDLTDTRRNREPRRTGVGSCLPPTIDFRIEVFEPTSDPLQPMSTPRTCVPIYIQSMQFKFIFLSVFAIYLFISSNIFY